MILFVVPVGNVVGQQSYTNALRIDVYDKCEFKTMEFYKFQQAWFVFESKDSLTQITIANHNATYAPAPVFDTVIVYDKNMAIVAVFTEDTTDWLENVNTPMVGSDYYLFVKSNSYFDKCDFDLCLARSCVPDIDMQNLVYCANDDYFVVEFTACQTGTIGNLFINDNTLIESQQIQIGASPNTYYFSIPFTAPGTYSITFCIFSTISNINEYCETFTVTILPPPTIQITEGNVTICPGEFCFHDITTNAYEVDWDLYYNYPGVGWVDEHHQWNNNPNDEYCHTFTNYGSYQLIATATGVCGTNESTINISVLPLTAEFDWTNACVGQSVCFTGIANCGEFWHWNFGDGTTSTEQNPCHVYAQAGSFHVSLEVSPGIFMTHTVTIYSPIQPAITGDEYACDETGLYNVLPSGAFSSVGWAVNSPSGWVPTVPPDEFTYSWINGAGGIVYVETVDTNGCVAYGEKMVFNCCTNPETTLSFFNETLTSPQTYWHEVISVNGTLTIDANGTTSFYDCHFYMGVNAKIVITSNDIVNIGYHTKNAPQTIIEACDSLMWDGIFINDNTAKLYVYYSKIYDAKNAVVSLHGGVFDIKTSLFDKNYKHLEIRTYNGTHQGSITESVLTCSGTLLPQYPAVVASRTQYAVLIQNVSNIKIGRKNQGNIFDNCDVGIMSTNSFIEVVDNTFQNIEPGSVIPGQVNNLRGYGIATSSLDISGTNPYGLKTYTGNMSVGGNTFNNVTNGILSFNNGQVYIKYNKFNYTNNTMGRGTAISLSEWSHPVSARYITGNIIDNYNKGIVVTGTNNVQVSNNLVKNIQLAPIPLSNLSAMGIRIEGGSNNVVQGNSVQNDPNSNADWRCEGISVSNSGSLVVSCNILRKMGKSIRFQGVNTSVQIKKNDMYNGTAGIVLSDNGYINAQGTNGTPWDNRWIGSSFTSHLYTMNNTDASQIVFHLVLPISSYWTQEKYPQPFYNNRDTYSETFNLALDNGYLFMLCAIPLNSASPAYASWMDDLADNNIYSLNNPQYRNWLGRDKLYKTILQDSTLIQSSSLQSFKQQIQSETQGVLENVKELLHSNNIVGAKNLNQNLLPYTKPDSITQSVNSIGINAALTGGSDWLTAISSPGWDSLRMIAQLCPFEYGENVYLARVVLKMAGDTTEYANECETDALDVPGKSTIFGSDIDINTKIYPNPTRDEITIETDMSLPATLTLYSATGQQLYSVRITDSVSKVTVDFLKPQLLLYEIRNASGETSRGTLTKTE